MVTGGMRREWGRWRVHDTMDSVSPAAAAGVTTRASVAVNQTGIMRVSIISWWERLFL